MVCIRSPPGTRARAGAGHVLPSFAAAVFGPSPQDVEDDVRAAHDGDGGGELWDEGQRHLLRMRRYAVEGGHFEATCVLYPSYLRRIFGQDVSVQIYVYVSTYVKRTRSFFADGHCPRCEGLLPLLPPSLASACYYL